MKKAEISTSMIIYIVIAVIVLAVIVGGVIGRVGKGASGVDKEACRATNDANNDGVVDVLDICPCRGNTGSGFNNFPEDCKKCSEYIDCVPKTS